MKKLIFTFLFLHLMLGLMAQAVNPTVVGRLGLTSNINPADFTHFWYSSVDNAAGDPSWNGPFFETKFCQEPGSMTNYWTATVGGALHFKYNFFLSDGVSSYMDSVYVVKVGNGSFSHDHHLLVVSLDPMIKFIGNSAFFACEKLETVNMASHVKSIEAEAFRDCVSLNHVDLANAATSIGYRAFLNAPLAELKNYSNIASIGEEAFSRCNGLTTFTIPVSVSFWDVRAFQSSVNLDTVLNNMNTTSIPNNSFDGCTDLKKFSSTSFIKTVGYRSFADCSNLNSFDFSHIDSLSVEAFKNTGFTEVKLPEGLKRISADAFNFCQQLKKISLPSTLTNIESGAFNGTPLDTVRIFAKTPPTLSLWGTDDNVFGGFYYKTAKLLVPFGTSSLYRNALGWRQFTDIIEMAENITDQAVSIKSTLKFRMENFNLHLYDLQPDCAIEIYDINGKLLVKKNPEASETNISLPAIRGVYLIKQDKECLKLVL